MDVAGGRRRSRREPLPGQSGGAAPHSRPRERASGAMLSCQGSECSEVRPWNGAPGTRVSARGVIGCAIVRVAALDPEDLDAVRPIVEAAYPHDRVGVVLGEKLLGPNGTRATTSRWMALMVQSPWMGVMCGKSRSAVSKKRQCFR